MRKELYLALTALTVSSLGLVAAENAVVLEGFEGNIDSATLGTWGGNRVSEGFVELSLYEATASDDPNVTQGTNSLRVALGGYEGWVNDFIVNLSDEASDKVRQAAASTDVARYVLRYDIIFPGGNSWMNNQAFIGNPAVNNQLNTPSGSAGGKATMSWPLDLIQGLPESGPILLRFADNFDNTAEDPFVGPMYLYVDNIRLVDTYAPGATPVTYVLQNFEGTNSIGGGVDFGGRSTLSVYAKANAEDIKVSEGTNSLQVTYTPAYGGEWKADFRLPFANTKLAEILKLDKPVEERPTAEELARYTMRYDIIFPDRDENNQPSWGSTQQYADGGSWLPFSENRKDLAMGQVQTVSFTLDTLPNWGENVEIAPGAPVMAFIAQLSSDTPFNIWYDNFRLIDTGGTGGTPSRPRITDISLTPERKLVITWTGGGSLQSTTSLTNPQWSNVAGATSGVPIDPPAGGVAFYRISSQ